MAGVLVTLLVAVGTVGVVLYVALRHGRVHSRAVSSDTPEMLLPALVTVVTKVVTGWYAARRAGSSRRGRLRAGGALVARGEFSIVIAGLAVGAEPDIGPLATAYVLLLVIAGPLAARWTEPAVGVVRRRLPRRRADTGPWRLHGTYGGRGRGNRDAEGLKG